MPAAVAVLLLVSWPFAHRYTSIGVDFEAPDGDTVRCVYWRLRWPGDGSVALLRTVERRSVEDGPIEPFDLGGAVLQPTPDLEARTVWQRAGFWWVVVRTGERAPPIVAGTETAFLVAVPHAGLAVFAAVVWFVVRRHGRRSPLA